VGFLIDTSVLIDAERGRLNLSEQLARRGGEPAYLSVITVSEILVGVHRSTDPAHRARRAAYVERMLRRLAVLVIDLDTARAHAQISAVCSAAGTPVGPHDLWLAATAMTRGLTLVTLNTHELGRVPGLRIASWPDSGATQGAA
jgi:tRNA(fMet)-specific endonuclease VapC